MGEGPNILLATTLLVASVGSSFLIGGLVLARNPWKRTHRFFALLALNLMLWSLGVLLIIHSHTADSARLLLMATFAVASFLPATFYQFVVFFPYQRFQGSRTVLGLLYAGGGAVMLMLDTPYYIQRLDVFADKPPLVSYGSLFYLFSGLVIMSMAASFTNLMVKLRETSGIQRRQVEHVVIGIFVSTGFASLTNVLAPALQIGTLEPYGPCFMVLLMGILAYSMVRYHLLDIWVIVSRTTVYAVMTIFVIATFAGAVTLVHWFFRAAGRVDEVVTTVLAALVVVLFILPLKERIQLLLDRVVLHRRYDSKGLIERISRNAAQHVKLDELLDVVAGDVKHTIGVRVIRVFLVGEKKLGTLVTEYSTEPEERGKHDINHDFLLAYVQKHPEPVVLEEVLHGRPSEERAELAKCLAEMNAYLLVPLNSTLGIVGLIALGQKTTRDMYTQEDVKVFATVAGTLGKAIENARLYRKLEELNLHLERIVRNMRGGVVAVDAGGVLATVNDEAREILGNVAPGQPLDALGGEVAELLRRALREKRDISDVEAVLTGPGGGSIPVVMSASCFDSAERENLGAVVLLYNMTHIKRLESNVQRADRLTSIGTMAAGMAHEIKNPLQSIKTFTQLLPTRFDDEDFRKTFIEVVPPEVHRIDAIVTRLLDFARPKPTSYAPQNIRKVIEDVLALVENQLEKAGIQVSKELPEDIGEVIADEQRLHQVFLNLVLNAISAMKDREERRLTIRMYYAHTHLTRKGKPTLFDVPCVKVAVADTGCGIPEEHLDNLFTPFFTTKDDGSGLGLSVVHGIVTEHGGTIDVTSVVGGGASFCVTFPLVCKPEEVERVGT